MNSCLNRIPVISPPDETHTTELCGKPATHKLYSGQTPSYRCAECLLDLIQRLNKDIREAKRKLATAETQLAHYISAQPVHGASRRD